MPDNSLTYSNNAFNILNKFHESDHILLVEGDDDVLFWKTIFDKCNHQSITIQIADGGSTQIDKFIPKILSGELNIIVARDSDYLEFQGKKIDHPYIMYTYGYAIENTLVTKQSVSALIKCLCRDVQNNSDEIDSMINKFEQSIQKLLTLDLVNEIYSHGVSILGKSHQYFTQKSSPHNICPALSSKFIDEECSHFETVQITHSESLLSSSSKEVIEIVRGHFLSGWARVAIKKIIKKTCNKKTTISEDMFYSFLLSNLDASFNTSHSHYNYYNNLITNLTTA